MSRNDTAVRLAARRRRRALMLAAGCALILLLTGAVFGLTRWQEMEQAAQTTESTPTVPVATLPASGSVDTLSFTDTQGQMLTFRQTENGWALEGDADFAVDTAALDNILALAVQLYAHAGFAPGEELSAYGLEEPAARVTLTNSTAGDSTTLVIGDELPLTGYRYLMVEGQADTVYTVNADLLTAISVTQEELRLVEGEPAAEESAGEQTAEGAAE